ncbi:MAG TPA: tetratricopeptide repeat protein, partial [Acetobacteraceae bacterium]|nr:tetratricopeptide repeat protein [Acetobacteraceae bacterium]
MTADAPQAHPLDLDDILLEANEAHRAGDFVAAEQGYAAVLAASPGNFIVLNLLGALCGQTGRHAESVAYLRRAAALRPSDPEIQKNLGIAYEVAGDLTHAAGQYARALALAPNLAAAHFGLGVCHEAAGRTEAALASYHRAAALAPDHAPTRNNLGSLLSESDPVAAEAALRHAIDLDPAYPEPRNNLGALLLSLGRPADACPVLQEAVALRPFYADAMANLGTTLCSLGRMDEGIAMLRGAVAADPAAILPRIALAGMLMECDAGVTAAAETEALLRAVLAEEPGHAEATLRLSDLLYQCGRFAEAEALLAPLSEKGPKRGSASLARVQTRRMTQADRGFVATLRSLAEAADLPMAERVAALFALGKVHHDLGDPQAAMRALDAGNALRRSMEPPFDRAAHAAFVDRLIATYTPGLFAARCPAARLPWASTSRRPILIVGMMRSGTTLVEQMLSAHPAVAAGGELTFWPMHGQADVPPVDAAAAAALVAGYLG